MAEIVNLRQARKRKAREAARAVGGANRTATGVSKIEKSLADARREKAERHLDGHRLDD